MFMQEIWMQCDRYTNDLSLMTVNNNSWETYIFGEYAINVGRILEVGRTWR